MREAIRKTRKNFTLAQKLDYAKLMVEEGYSNHQVMAISGAGATAVCRWKRQYIAERNGITPQSKAMTAEQQEIQSLKRQLWRAKRDNEILKKATALFATDNQ